LAEVIDDLNRPEDEGLPEILVSDRQQLAIFHFEENSEPWDFPRDAPPRYQPIGFFQGNIGATAEAPARAVTFNEQTKDVTVIDRNGFERSQLAVRSVYGLNPVTNSYWDNMEPLGGDGEQSRLLAAPKVSTIDFFPSPPIDLLGTVYPEKIVLGFYTSTCGQADLTICNNTAGDLDWQTENFLIGEALNEFRNGNAGYFGLPSFTDNQNISINLLRYYPQLETDPDLRVTGQGRDVVTGEEPRFNRVDVGVVVDGLVQTLRFEVALVEGEWKMVRRVELLEPVISSEVPADIDALQQP
jgi:hypothetical protein